MRIFTGPIRRYQSAARHDAELIPLVTCLLLFSCHSIPRHWGISRWPSGRIDYSPPSTIRRLGRRWLRMRRAALNTMDDRDIVDRKMAHLHHRAGLQARYFAACRRMPLLVITGFEAAAGFQGDGLAGRDGFAV